MNRNSSGKEYLLKSSCLTWEYADVLEDHFELEALNVKDNKDQASSAVVDYKDECEMLGNINLLENQPCENVQREVLEWGCTYSNPSIMSIVPVKVSNVDVEDPGSVPIASDPVYQQLVHYQTNSNSSDNQNSTVQHSCSICHKNFLRKSALTIHMRSHAREKPFSCSLCEKTFSYEQYLRQHLYYVHPNMRPYPCDLCGRTFKLKGNLTSHLRSHAQKRYKCTECDASYTRKCDCDKHMRIHNGHKPYTCNYCEKGFSEIYILNRHLLTHSEERPFTCTYNQCNKTFKSNLCLNCHIASHSRKKTFICTYDNCYKRFTSKGELKVHTRSHTGEKPFSCSICNKTFSQSGNCKMHMIRRICK